jgi:hypothetical protein
MFPGLGLRFASRAAGEASRSPGGTRKSMSARKGVSSRMPPVRRAAGGKGAASACVTATLAFERKLRLASSLANSVTLCNCPRSAGDGRRRATRSSPLGSPVGVRSGATRVRCGGTAVRSGGTGVRSGGTGVRSGRTGVRSGGTGVRSGGTGVRSGAPGLSPPVRGGTGVRRGSADSHATRTVRVAHSFAGDAQLHEFWTSVTVISPHRSPHAARARDRASRSTASSSAKIAADAGRRVAQVRSAAQASKVRTAVLPQVMRSPRIIRTDVSGRLDSVCGTGVRVGR